MRKIFYIVIQFFMLFFFLGCTWFQNETIDDYLDVFSLTSLDLSQFTYNETAPYQYFDRVLMVNKTDTSMTSHLIISSNDMSLRRDDKMKVEKDYIYRTKDMTKSKNLIGNNFEEFLNDQSYEHYEFMGNDFLNKTAIENLIHIGENVKLSKHRDQYKLKFYIPYEHEMETRVNLSIEVVFNQNIILEFHYRFEHDYESTKQQNNYIYGYHVYFGYDLEIEFPNLSLFIEV
jgi:hypothetical protein